MFYVIFKRKNCFFDLYDNKKEKIYNYAITYQSYKDENETIIKYNTL